jgi:murein DD-endopeptidase MepM/ murein hydrolase activator NlpD
VEFSRGRHSPFTAAIIAGLGVVCAVAMALAAPGTAAAAPGDDAKDAGRAVDRAEAILEHATATARNAARRLEAATAALPEAQRKVATGRGLVVAASVQATTARRKAHAARASYNRIAGRFEQAQVHVVEARDRVDDIAAASYMGGNLATLNVLVGASGPQDAMDRLGLVDQVMQNQQESVDQLVGARRTARTAQDRSGFAKRVAEETEQEAATKLAAAKDAQTAAKRARAAVIRLAQSRRSALIVARSQRSAVLAEYEEAKAEEDRIQHALRAWDHKSGDGGDYAGGNLRMPVHGWKSSDFGSRYDPYYHVWQLHAGADFAAGGGTPIYAAASGRVSQSGWYGGYGNYTCVNHGKRDGRSFSTCYGHQSKILVYDGEYVRRGEVIGRVGTTGASTGFHLHFETRFDGVPKNPLNYLPGCLC